MRGKRVICEGSAGWGIQRNVVQLNFVIGDTRTWEESGGEGDKSNVRWV